MKIIPSAALIVASALATQAALVPYTILMPTGGGGGAFDNVTFTGVVGGSAIVPAGSGVTTANLFQGGPGGIFIGGLSLTTTPIPGGSVEIYFTSTPIVLTAPQFGAFMNTNVWVSLDTAGGVSVANAPLVPVPEPETFAAAAALGLAGFGLWRRRRSA